MKPLDSPKLIQDNQVEIFPLNADGFGPSTLYWDDAFRLGMSLQNDLVHGNFGVWLPPGNANTAPLAIGMIAPSLYGTAATFSVANTSLKNSMRRVGNNSSTTAGTAGGWRTNNTQLFRNVNEFYGGYRLKIIFAEESVLPSSRAFAGLRNTATAIGNVEPSTLTNIIGVGYDSTDSTWCIMHNDGAGIATKVPLTGFSCNTSDRLMFVEIIAPPNHPYVYINVGQPGFNAVVSHRIEGDMIGDKVLSAIHVMRNNHTNAASAQFSLVGLASQTNFYK